MLFLIFAAAVPVVWAGDATAPGASCGEADQSAGMQQAVNSAIYTCTTTGATRNWYPQPLYFGTSSATCDSAHAALTRYNAGAIEFCNGSAWTALSSGSDIVLGSTATGTNPSRSGDLTTGLFSPAADNVAISAAGAEALRVTANGNVGIGTDDRVRKL
ncbi:MAG: hypothetical protein REJ50_00525 [Bordetella sp.]|nr:hypothetical protein [Bordetella sp.]